MSNRIFTADVGGTHARLAIVDVDSMQIARFQVVSTHAFPTLAELCDAFLRSEAAAPMEGVIAIAGVETEGHIEGYMLPWRVPINATRRKLHLPRLAFINDFVAAALGTREVTDEHLTLLSRFATRSERPIDEPVLVLGPGTGLGAAALVPDNDRLTIVASEAGQAAFAPGNELEIELLHALRGDHDVLTIGDLLSGTGLSRIDHFLRARKWKAATSRTPAQITTAAQYRDPDALASLELFCELLGSIAGDLALIYKARGGVYLAGGILPRIKSVLLQSRFIGRFVAKGVMREFLEGIPVSLVEHPHLGVLGAARWFSLHRNDRLVWSRTSRPPRAPYETQFFREATEAPHVVAQQLARNAQALGRIGQRLREHPPRAVLTCARGSSDHAATYARYLIETRTGVLTSSISPSIHSVYEAKSQLQDTVCLAISQSGASPDLLASIAAAKKAGAWTLALVNCEDSPLSKVADETLPLCAGEERSVAASKSYIASLSAIAQLVLNWTGDAPLLAELTDLPNKLEAAWQEDWSSALPILQPASSLYVIARGLGLGVAQEAALKLKETCGLHAEAHSSAELRHGPLALVRDGFPVLLFSQDDETRPGMQALATELSASGATLLLAGLSHTRPGTHVLPTQAADPIIAPLLMIQSFYRLANALALARGYDPDHPPRLTKITETV